MTSDQNKYTPTMAEECYIISRKKPRYSKLREQLKKLENRLELLDDDMLELKREIDDIKKSLSYTLSGSEFEYEYDEKH